MRLQVTAGALAASRVPGGFEALRQEFARTGLVRLPAFLSPDLLAWVRRRVAGMRFRREEHPGSGPDARPAEPGVDNLLAFLLNDPALFRAVGRITGGKPPASLVGQMFRMDPGGGHRCGWHDDVVGDRMLGLSINLGGPFGGGVLRLRDRRRGRILREVANTGLGDAVLFRVAPGLDHSLTPVTGVTPRLVYAGWFRSRPDRADVLKEGLARGRKPRARPPARRVSGQARHRAAAGVCWRPLGGRTLLYAATAGILCELDRFGGRVWADLARGVSPDEAAKACASAWDVPLPALRRDLRALAADLVAQGMLAPR